jgi:ubiquitin C-terminal hydrolase
MITRLVNLQKNFHIQLNRFDFFGFAGPQKLNNFIPCPQQHDLENYLIAEHQNPSTIYQLYGILVHSRTALSSHYISELNLGINKNVQNDIYFIMKKFLRFQFHSIKNTIKK